MRSVSKAILGFCLVLHLPVSMANEYGSPAEAIAMVKKAGRLIRAEGPAAYAKISDPQGQFVDRDMYVYVTNMQGVILAHGATPKVIGKDIMDIQDGNGKFVMKEILQLANGKGSGWVDYQWPNTVNKAIEAKSTYIEKVGNVVVACGIFRK
ncbi:cache domain-containing protein [Undibacterium sp. Di27W]|uniref:cache domain-containing protein n=1 Tax=Undibacterium sp. Di27W TaxID=3413036 RepID=UPI003BF37340